MSGLTNVENENAAASNLHARRLERIGSLFSVLVILLAAVALTPGVTGDFFFADSREYILQNTALQTVPLSEFWRVWQTELFRDELLPIRDLVYRIEFQAFGLEPIPYKIINLLLLGLCGYFVWLFASNFHGRFLADRSTGATPGILAAAVLTLWVTHPSHVESVAWIAGLKDVLSGLFGLAALYFFQRTLFPAGKPLRTAAQAHVVTTLLFVAALMSKVTVAPLAGTALLLAIAAHSESLPWRQALVKGLYTALPLLIAAVVAVSIYAAFATANLPHASSEITGGRIERALRILGTMYQIVLIPYDMRLIWDVYQGGALGVLRFVLALLAILGGAWGAWAFAFRRIPEGFGLAAAAGATVPVLHLIPFDSWSLASERHLFWPLFGLALAAVSLASRIAARGRPAMTMLTLAAGLIAAAWLGLSLHRSLEWSESPERLYVVQNEADPAAAPGALLRIRNELRAGRRDLAMKVASYVEDEAQREMLEALVRASQSVAQAAAERGARDAIIKADQAMLTLEAAVRTVLDSASNPTIMWLVYTTHKSLIPLYRKLIALAPDQAAFPYNLALINKNSRYAVAQAEAERLFLRAIRTGRLPPAAGANAWLHIANIRLYRGDDDGGLQALSFAMAADPAGHEAALRLVEVKAEAGDPAAANAAAVQYRKRALAAGIKPEEIAAKLKELGSAYNMTLR